MDRAGVRLGLDASATRDGAMTTAAFFSRRGRIAHLLAGTALVSALSAVAPAARGQETNWSGAISTDFNAVGNWSNGLPAAGVMANITTLTANKPTISGSSSVEEVSIRDNALTINTGADLSIVTGSRSASGIAWIGSGGGSVVVNHGTINVARYIHNFGTLTTTGVINGEVANSKAGTPAGDIWGTVEARGVINGRVFNEGVFNLTGALQGTIFVNAGGALNLGTHTLSDLALLANTFTGTLNGSGGIINTQRFEMYDGVVNTGVTIKAATEHVLQGGTVHGVLGGTGSLVARWGAATLNNANSYGGGTTIQQGTLNIGHMGALGSGAVTLQNGGRLNSTVTGSFGGMLEFAFGASSTVSAAAGQTLSLDGNIHLGGSAHFGTTGDTGTIAYGGSGGGSLLSTASIAVDGGTLRLGAFGRYHIADAFGGTSIASGATLDINGHAKVQLLSGAGTVLNGNGAAAMLTANNIADSLFAGGIRDGAGTIALDKTGTGRLTLTGANAHTGGTTVSQGELRVDGSLGSGAVTVAAAGTLSGTGSIAGAVTVNGTLSAGHSPGTLTVGSLVLNSGATSIFELNSPGVVGGSNPATGNDLVKVTGDLTLGGSLDARVAAAGYYRLFDYGGTLAGRFDLMMVHSTTAGFRTVGAQLETGVAGQVNLAVLGVGQAMQFWDGTTTTGSGSVNGGAGTWASFGTNWTTSTGSANAGWGGSVGVFAGSAGGAVTVAGTQGFDTLQFKTNGYALSGGTLAIMPASGRVGTFNIDSGITVSIASAIADGGGTGLEKAGGGTLILSGLNTYTGGTTISQGTLAIAGTRPLGTGAVTLNGGTLRMADCGCGSIVLTNDVTIGTTGGSLDAGAGELEIGGSISGSGALTITGSGGPLGGYVVFSGDNRYGGQTRITANGILLALSPTSLSPNSDYIVDGILDPGGFDATLRSLSGAASGRIGSSGVDPVTLTVAGGGSFDGTILNGGPGAVSLVKTGTGTLTLNGQNSYTGTTTVEGGTLVVGGAGQPGAKLASAVTVKAGGTLGGIGTIGGLTVASGGTVAPGNSIGTLTVSGDVALGVGSFYAVEIGPDGASDRIVASGRAVLSGGTVTVAKGPGAFTPGMRYTILTAAGGVSGSFAGLSQSLPFLDLGLSYDPGTVYLDIARNQISFPSVGLTRNQIATGSAVEALGQGNTLHDAVLQQASAAEARQAFDALSGEIHASATGVMIERSRDLRQAVNDRLRQAAVQGAGGNPALAPVAAPVLSYAAFTLSAEKGPFMGLARPAFVELPYAFWGQAFGSWGRIGGNSHAAGITSSTGGFLIGADAGFGETWRLGLAGGYGRTTLDGKARLSSGTIDSYHAALYGSGQFGALALRFGGSYTWNEVDTKRAVSFAGFSDQTIASDQARTAQVFGEAAYGMNFGTLALEPFANLALVHLDSDGFTERGGAAVLRGRRSSESVAFTTLGLHLGSQIDLGEGMVLSMRSTLGWRHAFGDMAPKALMAFASGGSPFTIAGTPIARDALVADAGIELALSRAASLSLSYSGQFGNKAQENAVKGNVVWRF
ncbi:autotransporter domain-containing protein [Bosea sp. 2KB_26]|uniref:autotransporter domain-containing protein n=1 Tax=Bosea sp. 2KB_26 TaxID=3237475 RepID=UPI003F91DED6